jgi:hypothetical protein
MKATASAFHPEIRRHIIVDSSNIFIGAKSRPGNLNSKIILDSTKLANLLIRNRNVQGTRVIAGSVPTARNPAWQLWEQAGFRIKICHFEHAEDMVDEFLHAQAMNIVMERHGDLPGQNTLVLCTGDGNDNQGFSNFVNVARNSARMGWRVEIWSWQHCRSQNFVSLVQEYPDRVHLHYLDAVIDEIVVRFDYLFQFLSCEYCLIDLLVDQGHFSNALRSKERKRQLRKTQELFSNLILSTIDQNLSRTKQRQKENLFLLNLLHRIQLLPIPPSPPLGLFPLPMTSVSWIAREMMMWEKTREARITFVSTV